MTLGMTIFNAIVVFLMLLAGVLHLAVVRDQKNPNFRALGYYRWLLVVGHIGFAVQIIYLGVFDEPPVSTVGLLMFSFLAIGSIGINLDRLMMALGHMPTWGDRRMRPRE